VSEGTATFQRSHSSFLEVKNVLGEYPLWNREAALGLYGENVHRGNLKGAQSHFQLAEGVIAVKELPGG